MGQFRHSGQIAQGAFGQVYRAWDPALAREVALKLYPTVDNTLSSEVVEEGRMLARLRHQNIATVYGAAIQDGRVGLWMELIKGQSLAELLASQGPMSSRKPQLLN